MRRLLPLLVALSLAGCGGPSTEQVQGTVVAAVAATTTAQPTQTPALVEVTSVVTQIATVVVTATPRPATATSAVPTSTPAPAAGKWQTDSDTSSFDDSTTVVLLLDAENEISGTFETARPTLIVRCKERTQEAYVSVGMQPDVETGNLDGATIRLRFDKEDAFEANADLSTDGTALFMPVPDVFIKTLLNYETLVVGFTPFQANPVEITFDLRGLEQAIPPFYEACPE